MEELWRETRISAEPESEVVLTYRQPDGVEPVTLRYERELPERMRPRPEERAPYPPAPKGANPLNPPEKPRTRWGVRVYVGMSLLVILICLGVGIWYVDQYGWALPESAMPDLHPGQDDRAPWEDDYFYWDTEEPENTAITIPAYPTGGETRLSLSAAGELPAADGAGPDQGAGSGRRAALQGRLLRPPAREPPGPGAGRAVRPVQQGRHPGPDDRRL